MALIKCPDCGKEFSDQAAACPNCGRPNTPPQASNPSAVNNNNWNPNTPPVVRPSVPTAEKHSSLSIVALILSILGCTFWLGIVLAIIDLCTKDKTHKHTLSKASIFISVLWFILIIAVGTTDTESNPAAETTTAIEETVIVEETNEYTGSESENETVTESEEVVSEAETTEENEETETEVTVSESRDEFIATCQEISYKDLLRNPDDYIGERIIVVAKVQQVMQGGWLDDNEYYRIQTDNDGYEWYLDDEYFMYDYRVDDDTKLLQDDILKIYAEFAGLETVKRALTGVNEEIPAIKAYYVDIIGE